MGTLEKVEGNNNPVQFLEGWLLITYKFNRYKISVFPNFDAEVQKQRLKCQDGKKRPCDLHLQYSMLFPTGLWVVAQGKVHFFESAKACVDWLAKHEQSLQIQRDC